MNESMGGLVNIVLITIFIVIAMGYIAFNINYTKAFRMKDKIITIYDKYEGNCNNDCLKEIQDYAREIGYSSAFDNNDNYSDYQKISDLYVFQEVKLGCTDEGIYSYSYEESYYKIVTKINLSIPIIDKFMGFDFLYVNGDTRTFKGGNCSNGNNSLIDEIK